MPGIIDNKNIKLRDVLKEAIKDDDVKRLRIGVGYFYISGLKSLFPEIEEVIERGGKLDILMVNVVNRETMEYLISEYKDQEFAISRQPNHIISSNDKYEMETGLKDDFKNQLLFTKPNLDNQSYISKISRWIDEDRLRLKVYTKEQFHAKAYVIECEREGSSITRPELSGVVGSSNLTLAGLTSNTELNATVYKNDADELQKWFEDRWEDADDFTEELLRVIDNSWANFIPSLELPDPFLVYIKTIYELYKESLETMEEYIRSFQVYQELYDFQKWAVLRAANIALKYGGVMVSDVVGMGKTYVGLALLEHFYHRNHMRGSRGKTLIICPKKLETMWNRMVTKFSLHADVVSMGLLSTEAYGNELLEKHGDTQVVLIDESHHYRNTGTIRYENISQFLPITNEVILLSATPYTKGPTDVLNQVKLFHLDNITSIPITPPNLQEFITDVKKGDANLSELLSYIMVRRTRYDIVSQYGGTDEEGREYIQIDDERRYLPDRKLKTTDYSISDVYGAQFYNEIVDVFEDINYARYSLGSEEYLKPNYRNKSKYKTLSSIGSSLRGLLKSNILKRLESSIFSFKETLRRMVHSYSNFYGLLDKNVVAVGKEIDEMLKTEDDPETILKMIEEVDEGDIYEYDVDAFNVDKLKKDLHEDLKSLQKLYDEIDEITEEISEDYTKDNKLLTLCELLEDLYSGDHQALSEDDEAKKIVVFTEYKDTVNYLGKGISWLQEEGHLEGIRFETATSDTGNIDNIIERFAPESNEARHKIDPEDELDLILTTDVMSEGLNLQDANLIINYDIHWNPLKLIQRIGRVDRLGTKYECVYAFNFLPETQLEEQLGIIEKVSKRVDEINAVLGMDGQILTEEDKLNKTFMERIYDEDIKEIEDYEKNVLLGDDEITGSVNQLQKISSERPELIDKIKKLDGIRSGMEWTDWRRWRNEPFDAVFVLCKAGDYTTPYIIGFPKGEEPILMSKSQEEVLEIIACDEDEIVPRIEDDVFTRRYGKAVEIASKSFEDDIRKREKLTKVKKNVNREYVENRLNYYRNSVEDSEQKKAIKEYIETIHTVTAKQILKEMEEYRKKEITGERLFDGIKELITKYGLEERFERKKELKEKLNEPTHVLCGLYLKAE
ncbi:MAG: helicase-related protein [Elusimicrobiota bacterium]